jgi:TRAP-type C4-dicarboxylate transport system permease small subunit
MSEPDPDALPRPPEGAGRMAEGVSRLGLPFALLFVASMLCLLFEIVMRYLFQSPTLWVHETTVFMCATTFIFGGLYCTSLNRHIRIVIIYEAVGPRVRRALDVFIYSVCALASAAFAYAAWRMARNALFTPSGTLRLETSGTAWNPPIPAALKLFLLLALVAITLQFVALAWNAAKRRI